MFGTLEGERSSVKDGVAVLRMGKDSLKQGLEPRGELRCDFGDGSVADWCGRSVGVDRRGPSSWILTRSR